jgi:hypothetical protein
MYFFFNLFFFSFSFFFKKKLVFFYFLKGIYVMWRTLTIFGSLGGHYSIESLEKHC